LTFARARPPVRVVLLAALICLLALPAPPLYALPGFARSALPIASAVGRALALVALFCIPSAAAIPPGLRRAALSAGATKLRAWRDAVLAQIWLPTVLGVAAAWLRP
jgi:ABC-type spermidine/putrescine transport system permease subunit II